MIKRRCISCNEIKEITSMIKITKNYKNDEIIINPDKFHFGRSVYVCMCENCVNTAFKKNKLSKNLKKNLSENEKENISTVLNRMLVVQH